MKSKLERYLENIVQQTEGTQDEKEDLYEELHIHLQLSQEQLMKEGLSKKDAEREAMKSFGSEKQVGDQIQQAMFPYRKEMILTLAVASLLFAMATYLFQLFVEGDAPILWLLVAISTSTFLLYLSINNTISLNPKKWVNSILIFHLFTYLWGWGLSSSLYHPASLFLTLWVWLILLGALLLVYRTTLYDFKKAGKPLAKEAKVLHGINITSGIIITGGTLFFLWVFLAFGGFTPLIILFSIPFLAWIILYVVQFILLKNHKRLAYTLAAIPILLSAFALIYFFFPHVIR